MDVPGRTCPLDYRYAARDLARTPELSACVLYVVGGLYGNPFALDAVDRLAAEEPEPPLLVFNGDFNWFNVDRAGFEAVNRRVLAHVALRGNVETELCPERSGAGCGCGYPDWVPNEEVERSNRIEERLRETARTFPELARALGALPMYGAARVGGVRVGIVHGDAQSLAGWSFSAQTLAAGAPAVLRRAFEEADVRIFASTHTCLPVLRRVAWPGGEGLVINNGAAGMPNFRSARFGVVTRIATRRWAGGKALYSARLGDTVAEALPVHYDHARWQKAFLANWPPGSPAFDSYFDRILRGPDYGLERARLPSPGEPGQQPRTVMAA